MARTERDLYAFKVVLIGDGGTGKTTYINRVRQGGFIKDYVATVGAVVHEVRFTISEQHDILFYVWDTAGQEMHSILNETYYLDADGAIIMFDITSRITFTHVPFWLQKLRNVSSLNNNEVPVVVCGNKVDIKDRKVKAKQIMEGLSRDILHYTDISAKSNYNFEVPFLVLARRLTGINNLVFLANISLAPAEVSMSEEALRESMNVMQDVYRARTIELPEDEL
ncbi:small Ras GTP-binding protein [Hamiltosporidium tvaerminnensis]|uniref:Small Ras GTP-binding protein n=2 Tax=Hamiltosporidium TaxID=1176354 RepID=A0A4Q9L8Y5_9MICR|nr:hypothetical protein LUQ84_002459 [Hamiltosporidium tvaerminnensis]TBU03672.1 small Ras GTP-binding protein [Hamiltosporidium magnivora]TBU02303.1 small Ras GTP-binding protein [Hamiltosporidium tvaerminnensis]TBU04199.1 small Ras GTP-binding protein [Hamiltosporidium magnivora]TBU10465.1 small Ras GTP-binding protein [Hamiltosporidium tvaerminnensis]